MFLEFVVESLCFLSMYFIISLFGSSATILLNTAT
uniref:Uncharacterized protein n=1 Tax=Arundo donax TaxID=35708 RepID=A0A0A9B0Y6_ARUDO